MCNYYHEKKSINKLGKQKRKCHPVSVHLNTDWMAVFHLYENKVHVQVKWENTSGTDQDAGIFFIYLFCTSRFMTAGMSRATEGRIEEHSTRCNSCVRLMVNAHGPADPALDGTPAGTASSAGMRVCRVVKNQAEGSEQFWLVRRSGRRADLALSFRVTSGLEIELKWPLCIVQWDLAGTNSKKKSKI